ncbi:ABC transporter permease [Adlercreutzia sp. ZJ141]|uniref:ABC transporter permease n=1 Tax=Adlercreutzia sp. ZJ141 TaxID=2709406 RepID=UPI0013EC2EEE|nr:ABC transporter permease [Adlercreutzia sp. ZJ141]
MKRDNAANSELRRKWFVITSLVGRDFKLKYRRSFLGVLWSVLNPLLMMCVLSAVFSAFFKFDIENFPLYLILGQIIFNLMSDSTSSSLRSIIDSASLIKKIRIDKIVFPIEKCLFQCINFGFSLIAVAIVMLWFQIAPTWRIIYALPLVVFVLLFSMGLSMMLSSLAVFFRDVVHLWGVFLTAWTYATPLFYPVSILPDWMIMVEKFNPMFYFVSYFRDIMLYATTPSIMFNLQCFGFAIITFLVGLLVFKMVEKKFILYI